MDAALEAVTEADPKVAEADDIRTGPIVQEGLIRAHVMEWTFAILIGISRPKNGDNCPISSAMLYERIAPRRKLDEMKRSYAVYPQRLPRIWSPMKLAR